MSGLLVLHCNQYTLYHLHLVLTNNHVIDKADKIKVTLQDGRQLTAELIGNDPESDVAVVQIPSANLSELPIADC